ncbi:hypothetical protein N9L18_00935 [Candidatus Pacebacteria bacterium]|nr:hypothetical protein [Candidatus Paceibacterota bacterium]
MKKHNLISIIIIVFAIAVAGLIFTGGDEGQGTSVSDKDGSEKVTLNDEEIYQIERKIKEEIVAPEEVISYQNVIFTENHPSIYPYVLQRIVGSRYSFPYDNKEVCSLDLDPENFGQYCDYRLIMINEDGSLKIIEESLKKALERDVSLSYFNQGVVKYVDNRMRPFSVSEGKDKILFKEVTGGHDGAITFYMYSFTNYKFTSTALGRTNFSPDKNKIVYIEEDRKIIVKNIFTELKQEVEISLEEGESLFRGESGMDGSPTGNFEWIDNNAIRYGVFDSRTELSSSESEQRDFIRYEEISI